MNKSRNSKKGTLFECILRESTNWNYYLFSSPTGDRTAPFRGHPSHAKDQPFSGNGTRDPCSTVQGPVPERPISANPGLKFCSIFVFYLAMNFLRVTFCVIVTVSRSKG